MNRHFAPLHPEHQPMYHDTSRDGFYSYSPIPLREYQRDTEAGKLVIQSKLLRTRRQSVWNLLWLTTPEIDDALAVIDDDSFSAHRLTMHPWLLQRYSGFIGLSRRAMQVGRSTLLVDDAVKSVPAAEFWQHAKKDDRFIEEIRRIAGDLGVESMEARALARDGIIVVNPALHHLHADRKVWVKDVQRTIDRTYELRSAWLNKASEFLRPYVERCGFKFPRVIVGMDNPSGARHGMWHPGSVGLDACQSDFIGISPALTGTPIVVATLVHELAHGIAGPSVGHYKPFWDICLRLGLRNTYSDRFETALIEQMEAIDDAHGPYPGAVWQYDFLEA